jgi:hypothetical protein
MFRLPLVLALLCAAIGRAQEPPARPVAKPVEAELPPTEFPKIVVKKLERTPGKGSTREQEDREVGGLA